MPKSRKVEKTDHRGANWQLCLSTGGGAGPDAESRMCARGAPDDPSGACHRARHAPRAHRGHARVEGALACHLQEKGFGNLFLE